MYKTLRGQTSGSFKTQKLLNQEYLVIPVVAMVEGVRFGANQSSAELGLASEFGHFPETWNNRPIVLGHPQIDGNFVSAGSPVVMDKYCIGTTMAANVDGKKLKLEAWLNTALEDKSDESKRMFERIRANEQIEVSVGFFTDVEDKSGEYNGQEYHGIWRNIATDHLAFLEEGTIGACSIADGCGAPRTNQSNVTVHINAGDTPTTLTSEAMMSIKNAVAAAVKNGAGGLLTHTRKAKTLVAQCGCKEKVLSLQTLKPLETKKGLEISAHHLMAIQSLVAQMIPDGLMSQDIETILSEELADKYEYAWVVGFTQSVVVYQAYVMNMGWCLYQQAFDIDADGAVTFTGEPVEVRLITRIVPESAGDGSTVDGNDVNTQNQPTTETDMTIKPTTQEGAVVAATETATAAAATTTPAADTATTTAVADTAKPEVQAKKPVTLQEYLSSAPEELRDVLSEGVKLQQTRKATLIKSLQDSGRCDLDLDFLKAQSLSVLEGLAKLAIVPVDYTGAAGSVNTQEDTNAVPAAPKALERKIA